MDSSYGGSECMSVFMPKNLFLLSLLKANNFLPIIWYTEVRNNVERGDWASEK